MRFVFLAGGFAGFAITALTGLLSGREVDYVLRDAMAGCLAGAFLFRWFWGVLQRAFGEALEAKRKADAAAQEAEQAAAKNK